LSRPTILRLSRLQVLEYVLVRMSRPGALLLTSLTLCVAARSTRAAAQGTNPPPPPVKEPAHGFARWIDATVAVSF
jgi:hypothetical protein